MLQPPVTHSKAGDIHYEIHTLQHGVWVIDEANIDRRKLNEAIDKHLPRETDGLRAVRVMIDPRNGFREELVVHAWPWWNNGVDMGMPAVPKLADVIWNQIGDLYTDHARAQLARSFATFLRSRHLCIDELLHHPAGGNELSEAWQIMQAGLQPVALQQSAIMGLSGPDRVRELTALVQKLFEGLQAGAKAYPPEIVDANSYPLTYNSVSTLAGTQTEYAMARIVSQHLAHAPNYLEKLRRLAVLADGLTSRDQAAPIDRMLASLFQSAGLIVELTSGRGGAQRLILLARLMVGTFEDTQHSGLGLQSLNELMQAGFLPRLRTVLRRRLIEEALRDATSALNGNLIAELSEIDRTGAMLEQIAPSLVGDPELMAVWQHRIGKLLTADNLQRVLVRYRQPTERLSVIASLFPMMRGQTNRDVLGGLLANLLSVPELLRELESETMTPSGPLQPLLKFHQRLAAYHYDEAAKTKLLNAVDEGILSIIDQHLIGKAEPVPLDKVVNLLKLWLPSPVEAGKSRDRVSKVLGEAIQKPEFFNQFWDSFRSDKVRQQAHEALERLLHEYGFKSGPAPARKKKGDELPETTLGEAE
jgi:hypothetical protein